MGHNKRWEGWQGMKKGKQSIAWVFNDERWVTTKDEKVDKEWKRGNNQ
jgi:hypothetical protein